MPFRVCPECQASYYVPDENSYNIRYRLAEHVCPPIWFVWDEDMDREDAVKVYTHDMEQAAKEFAEERCQDSEAIQSYVDGRSVFVSQAETSEIFTVRVYSEFKQIFHSRVLPNPTEPQQNA